MNTCYIPSALKPFGGATRQGRAFRSPSRVETVLPLYSTYRCGRRPETVRTVCHFRSFAEDVALHSTASGWWGAKAAPFRQSCCESKKRSCCTAAITKTAKKKKRAWQRCQRNCYFPNTNADSGAFFFDARFFLVRFFFPRFFFLWPGRVQGACAWRFLCGAQALGV